MLFKGSAVALVTPFTSENTVNYNKLEELVEFHIKNGTDAIVVCGTTGEASTLSDREHIYYKMCYRCCKQENTCNCGNWWE